MAEETGAHRDGGTTDGKGAAVVYYSRTGNTRSVATDIASAFDMERIEPIRPSRHRGYWNWLLRSFVPGSTVAIEPMQTDFRDRPAVFLGSPKWTISCPPINEFLDRAAIEDVPIGLFVTYGGFDERRFGEALLDRVEAQGGDVRSSLFVKRDRIGTETYRDRLGSFIETTVD